MAERFEKLFELPNNLYSIGSPVIVVAGALLKDTETGRIIVQLKYHSVSSTPIKAIKIGISAYDVSGKEIEGVDEYQYLDLDINNGQEFGSNKAIVLPNAITRSFTVKNLSVILFDGIIDCLAMPMKPLPQSQPLKVVLKDEELIKQYQIEVNKEAIVTPINQDVVWCCSCGEWNGLDQCTKCRASKIKVIEAFDLQKLSEHSSLRLTEEKLQRERQAAAEKAEQERLAELDRQRKLEQERKKAELTVKTKKVVKRVAKVVGIIMAAFAALIVAVIIYLNVTNKPIDDDFEQRNEYELHTLIYYVPESWEIDSEQSYDQMKYYVRYDNWDKFMCTMGIKYVGEISETTVDNVVAEYTSTYSDNANISSESIGNQEFAVVTYTEAIDDNVYYCNVYVTERNSSIFFVYFMATEKSNVIDVFKEIVDAVDFENYINPREDIYNNAIKLMGEGQYTEAISAFEEIIGYKDTQEKINECKEAINESKYSEAISLAKNTSYKKAVEILREIENYKDATELIKKYEFLGCEKGDEIIIGSYEQDNDINNGTEDIEWVVLERNGNKALVISKYCIEQMPFNETLSAVTWETCTLRKWLNSTFLNTAFSGEEQTKILASELSNEGNDTVDKIFLLSESEATKYFESDSERRAEATEYVSTSHCYWRLRTTGSVSNVAHVDYDGAVGYYENVDRDWWVRPVMWIEIRE